MAKTTTVAVAAEPCEADSPSEDADSTSDATLAVLSRIVDYLSAAMAEAHQRGASMDELAPISETLSALKAESAAIRAGRVAGWPCT